MADPNPTAPSPGPLGHFPASDEVVNRLLADYQSNLDAFNHLDPKSLVYGRPDLAQQYQDKLKLDFETLLSKYGIERPAPRSAEEIKADHFAKTWPSGGLSDGQAELIAGELEKEQKLDPADRKARAEALKKEFGDERYDHLVSEARATLTWGETLPEAATSNRFVLLNMAAAGRYRTARARARTAAGLPPE